MPLPTARRGVLTGLALTALAATALAGAPAAAAVPTAALRVVVTGPDGQVAPGVIVSVTGIPGYGTTDAAGVVLTGVEAASVTTICGAVPEDSALGGATGWATTCTRARPVAGETTTVRLQMKLGAAFSGHVTDIRTGRPVPGALVSFRITSCCTTDEPTSDDGTYVRRGLTPGPAAPRDVTVNGPFRATSDAPWGYATASVYRTFALRAGTVTTGIDAQLVPFVRVTGRVLDTTGAAVDGARVSVRTGADSLATTTTNARGAYLLLLRWDVGQQICAAADVGPGHPTGLAGQCRDGLLQHGTDVRTTFRLEEATS